MRQVPEVFQRSTPPSKAYDTNQQSLALFSIGIDIVGSFPKGKGQTKFTVVAIDYFTKWTEVEALTTITTLKIQNFV